MYPTCSQYSVQAIRKHGPAVGIMMTADRIMHEMDEQHYAPIIKVGGRHRHEDTVSDNDFWWYGK
jgi:putative component of membrane protein insertase Oxa1/YidC/SpoIIIJ protein YidD